MGEEAEAASEEAIELHRPTLRDPRERADDWNASYVERRSRNAYACEECDSPIAKGSTYADFGAYATDCGEHLGVLGRVRTHLGDCSREHIASEVSR